MDTTPSNPAALKGAALHYAGITFWMPPPFRHGHVILAFSKNGFVRDSAVSRMEQGFITINDEFVGRDVAATMHVLAGGRLHWPPNLYSEDLW